MSNVLITGGTGFVGGALAKRLHNQGDDIIITGRNEEIGRSLENDRIKFLQSNLDDISMIDKIPSGLDYIFHVGARSSLWGSYKSFYEANVLGTANIISIAEKKNVKRLIHVSTPSIYTEFKDKYMIKEDDELPNQMTYYSRTKLEAEALVNKAFKRGLETVILRPRAIFGRGDTALLPRIISANKRGVPVIDGGNSVIDITYIDNVIDALILGRDARKEALGQSYNITNGDPRPIIDIIKNTFDLIDIPFKEKELSRGKAIFLANVIEGVYKLFSPNIEPPITKYGVCVLANSQTLDISKASELLDYYPKVNIDEGLKRFSESWKENENKRA